MRFVRRIICVSLSTRRLVNRPARRASVDAPVPMAEAGARPLRSLPHLGMPAPRERSTLGVIVSVAAHAVVLFLLLAPIALRQTTIVPIEQGAGGPGPAGGGGGGTRGTGGDPERVRYVAVTPAPPAPAPAVATAVVPPPVNQPPEPKPEPQPVVPPTPAAPAATEVASASPATPSPVAGTGGGTGNDGSGGYGPGSGGGIGSGVGTGRGSGTGPGTGGGTQANYPPTPTEMFLPPLPAPSNVRGFRLIAEFDVDSTGRVLDFTFTETRNGGYNRQLRDVLRTIRFRPGTRPDGTPIRMKAQLEYTFF